jgi:hypothetical protein
MTMNNIIDTVLTLSRGTVHFRVLSTALCSHYTLVTLT